MLAARLGLFLATLVGAVTLMLGLLWAAPGDAVDVLPNADELRPVLEREWGLDKPLPTRLLHWFSQAVQGDLGTSLAYRPGAPVAELLAIPALRSIGWAATGLLLSLLLATSLAWITVERGRPVAWVARAVSVVPLFLLAHLWVEVLNESAMAAMAQGWIDRPFWFSLPDQPSVVRTALAITLLAVGSCALTDVQADVEAALKRIRHSGYVEAARARGAPTWPHVLLNLLPQLATVGGSRAAFFVGGLVILETVLLLNGVGRMLLEAAELRDHTLALGITVVLAATVASMQLLADGLRLWLDPRLSRIES